MRDRWDKCARTEQRIGDLAFDSRLSQCTDERCRNDEVCDQAERRSCFTTVCRTKPSTSASRFDLTHQLQWSPKQYLSFPSSTELQSDVPIRRQLARSSMTHVLPRIQGYADWVHQASSNFVFTCAPAFFSLVFVQEFLCPQVRRLPSHARSYRMSTTLPTLPSVLLGSLGGYVTLDETEAVRKTCRALRSFKCRQVDCHWREPRSSLIDKNFVREAHFLAAAKVQRGFPKLTTVTLHGVEGETCSQQYIRQVHEWMRAHPSCRFKLTFFGMPARLQHLNLSCLIDLSLTFHLHERDSFLSLSTLSVLQSLNRLTLFSMKLSARVRDVTTETHPLSVKTVTLRDCFDMTKASGFWILLPFLESLECHERFPIGLPEGVRLRVINLTIPASEMSRDYHCLRSLHIVSNILDREAQLVLEHLKNLSHLTIGVFEDGFVVHIPSLVSLHVGCWHRTSRVFVHPASQLQRLSVNYCGWHDCSLKDDFGTLFPSLTELCVSNRERSEMSVHMLPPLLETLCLTRVGLACVGAWRPLNLRNLCLHRNSFRSPATASAPPASAREPVAVLKTAPRTRHLV